MNGIFVYFIFVFSVETILNITLWNLYLLNIHKCLCLPSATHSSRTLTYVLHLFVYIHNQHCECYVYGSPIHILNVMRERARSFAHSNTRFFGSFSLSSLPYHSMEIKWYKRIYKNTKERYYVGGYEYS